MGQKQTTQGQNARSEHDPVATTPAIADSRTPVETDALALASQRSETAQASVRPSARPSFRPSAFGPPRVSQFPSAAPSLPPSEFAPALALGAPNAASQSEPCVEIDDTSAAQSQEEETTPTPSGPRLRVQPNAESDRASSQAVSETLLGSSQRGFRADLEEILPLVSTPSSLPPTLPAAPEKAAPRLHDPRRNRISFAIFGLMLAASAVPLVRYAISSTGQASSTAEQSESDEARADALLPLPATLLAGDKPPADPLLDALAAIEANLPADHVAAADQLLALGLRALSQREERMAEALLGRALKHDDDNPRAYYALARIRISQGNLEGAEGWIVSAIHKRPRRAEYHALYATVLEGLNRPEEAARARARAAELKTPN